MDKSNIGQLLPRDDSYFHNGQCTRLQAIGYDGASSYLIIDGNKHHFPIVD